VWKALEAKFADILLRVRCLPRDPIVWTLIDTSESSNTQLGVFLGWAYRVAKKQENMKIVCWDSSTCELVTGEPIEVLLKAMMSIKDGGGTAIRKVLEYVVQRMKKDDVVLVLTDGEIYDLADPAVQRLLATIAANASVCAFCTTYKETPVKGWRVIKLDEKEKMDIEGKTAIVVEAAKAIARQSGKTFIEYNQSTAPQILAAPEKYVAFLNVKLWTPRELVKKINRGETDISSLDLVDLLTVLPYVSAVRRNEIRAEILRRWHDNGAAEKRARP